MIRVFRLALVASALIPAIAFAQGPVQYRLPDNINNQPVSAATPLPVTVAGGGSNAAAGTTGAAPPGSASYTGFQNGAGNLVGVSPANPLPISGTITASLGAFAPTASTVALTATATSSNAAISGTGTILFVNNGAATVYVKFGTSNAVTAAATDTPVPAGQTIAFANGSNTYIAVLAASGSNPVMATPGTGLPALANSGGGSTSLTNYALETGGNLATIVANTSGLFKAGQALGAGSAIIGKFGIDQTTQGGTNGVVALGLAYTLLTNASATGTAQTNVAGGTYALDLLGTFGGSTVTLTATRADGSSYTVASYTAATTPTASPQFQIGQGTTVQAVVTGGTPSGLYATLRYVGPGSTIAAGPILTTASVPINVSTAVTTQLVAAVSGKSVYVNSYDLIAGGTTNVTFEYGTGTLCGTGTTLLTGAYPLTAQSGLAPSGGGGGPLFIAPSGNAVCVVNSAASQLSGRLAYAQQ